MKTRPPVNQSAAINWPQAVELYHKVLDQFYDRGDAVKAAPYALKLLRALNRLDPRAESLPGNEYRALIAEVDGDLDAAIAYRRRELRLLDRLMKTGGLQKVQLGWDDYADRLDLLALLYLEAGQLDAAWKTIRRSEKMCRDAGIPFDGVDVKADIEKARTRAERRPRAVATARRLTHKRS